HSAISPLRSLTVLFRRSSFPTRRQRTPQSKLHSQRRLLYSRNSTGARAIRAATGGKQTKKLSADISLKSPLNQLAVNSFAGTFTGPLLRAPANALLLVETRMPVE